MKCHYLCTPYFTFFSRLQFPSGTGLVVKQEAKKKSWKTGVADQDAEKFEE
jgi:hypothetical protein